MQKIGITECKAIKYEEINNNRYIDCANYNDCLSEAVKKNMQSFHCNNCHAFQEYKKAMAGDVNYIVNGNVIKRFRPGHIDLNDKNIGTLWGD